MPYKHIWSYKHIVSGLLHMDNAIVTTVRKGNGSFLVLPDLSAAFVPGG